MGAHWRYWSTAGRKRGTCHDHTSVTDNPLNHVKIATRPQCSSNNLTFAPTPFSAAFFGLFPFELLIFLRMSMSFDCRGRIEKVYSSNGPSGHVLIYDTKQGIRPEPDSDVCSVNPLYVATCQAFLEKELQNGIQTIEETRQRVVDSLAENQHVR